MGLSGLGDLVLTCGSPQSRNMSLGIELGKDKSLEEVLPAGPEVLIDYTKPDSVKARTLEALKNGVRVVVGTSGLTGEDYEEIEKVAKERNLGVVAAGNFTITGALAKHFSQIAAQYVPSWEIIDYGLAGKVDSPSGTTREVAEEMAKFAENQVEIPVEKTFGAKEARGARIGGAQVHSLRLPGYQHAFETILALPDERLIIRHEAGPAAETHTYGTLLAARKVMEITGVVRGLDRLMFG
jgi:4-hydroxy-tetrahydrodipicolinate reductase